MRTDNIANHMKQHNPKVTCPKCGNILRSDLLVKHETLCKDNLTDSVLERGPCLRAPQTPTRSSVEV